VATRERARARAWSLSRRLTSLGEQDATGAGTRIACRAADAPYGRGPTPALRRTPYVCPRATTPPRPCSFAAPRTAAKPRSWGGQVCVGSCGRCGRRRCGRGRCGRRARSGAGGRVSCHMVCATRRRHGCARRAYGSQGGVCARRVRRSARYFAWGRRGPRRRVDSVNSMSAAVAMGASI